MKVQSGWFVLMLICIQMCISNESVAQNENQLTVLHRWEAHRDAPNALYNHLLSQSLDLLQKRKAEVDQIATLQEWKQRQQVVMEKLRKITGPFPSKTPLNARITKTIEKENFRVEHIIYESRPGFLVTSSLFIPNNLRKGDKAPAVIYCSGHSAEGYRSKTYHSILLNLVNKGFVVFAFDPVGQGERLEYLDPETGESIVGPSTRQHALPGAQLFLTGNSLASTMIWDGIRAVDYLLTRDEVDPARIGITGRSGGGTQSAFIGALDTRIHAVAPEGYLTNFASLLQSIGPQDAEQNMMGMIAEGLDHADLLAVRAPKPAMMITTTNDFFNITGAKETESEIKRIYEAYGQPENFSRVEDVAPHSSTRKNREAMYAFFQKVLNNPGSPVDEELELLTPEEIQVTENGHLMSGSARSETTFSLNRDKALRLDSIRAGRARNTPEYFDQIVASARQISGYREPGQIAEPVLTGFYPGKDYTVEKYFLKGEGDYIMPYLMYTPKKPSDKILIYLHSGGKRVEAGEGGQIEAFVEAGYTVLAPDLIGQGEAGRGFFARDNYFRHAQNQGLSFFAMNGSVLINRSVVGIRSGDLVRLLRMIKEDNPGDEVYAASTGGMASELLHTAAFEPGIKGIALMNPFHSFTSIATERIYNPEFIEHTVPSALTRYDLPELIASLAPTKLQIINPTDGSGAVLGTKEADHAFSLIKSAYNEHNASENLEIILRTTPVTAGEISSFWMK